MRWRSHAASQTVRGDGLTGTRLRQAGLRENRGQLRSSNASAIASFPCRFDIHCGEGLADHHCACGISLSGFFPAACVSSGGENFTDPNSPMDEYLQQMQMRLRVKKSATERNFSEKILFKGSESQT